MENVILIVHLILAICLIGVVLLQRSEGGGLGMGGGGGGGAMTGRSAASALGRITWVLAIAFLATSITLTILSAQNSGSGSILDRISDTPVVEPDAPAEATLPGGGPLLPPSESDAPLLPPRAD
jgi:preprotein translocase subunit SecG